MHGLGHLTRVYGTRPVDPGNGPRGCGASSDVCRPRRGSHPRPRPRGVPDRLRGVEGRDLPHPARVGRVIRSRGGRAHGIRDRTLDARGRGSPGPRTGARRGARRPVGTRRRVHRRGPVRRRHHRHRVRAGPAVRGRARDAEALRRILGLPRRTQPRSRARGTARVAGRLPAPVRDGRPRRRGAQRHELVHRDRRRARGLVARAADRSAAAPMGLRRHGRLGLLRRRVPALDARRRGRSRRGGAAGPRGRDRRRAARTGRVSAPGRASGIRRPRSGGRRPRRGARALREGGARTAGCRLLDAPDRHRPRRRGAPVARPPPGRAVGRAAAQRRGAAARRSRPCGSDRPERRQHRRPDGVLLVREPRARSSPGGAARLLAADGARRRHGALRRGVVRAGLHRRGNRPLGTGCRGNRRPERPTSRSSWWATARDCSGGHRRRGQRRRLARPAGRAASAGRGRRGHRHPGRARAADRASVRPGLGARHRRRSRRRAAGLLPGEEGGPALAALLAGMPPPRGACPCRCPARRVRSRTRTCIRCSAALGRDEHRSHPRSPLRVRTVVHDVRTRGAAGGRGRGRRFARGRGGPGLRTLRRGARGRRVHRVGAVTNTGTRHGADVVQVYAHRAVASVTRPVAQLVAYARVELEPGESAEVRFTVPASRLAYSDRALRRVVEAGELELRLGPSCAVVDEAVRVRITGRPTSWAPTTPAWSRSRCAGPDPLERPGHAASARTRAACPDTRHSPGAPGSRGRGGGCRRAANATRIRVSVGPRHRRRGRTR